MNFKIEVNYINITNYPAIEDHFEEMANSGWLIKKIILGSLFIYEKIEAESLDFSITPYEVETAFTKKSKSELEEFQTVCENVGWNYATKSFDLHIYFKESKAEAMDIQTDDEEEFKTLDFIGKRQLKTLYIQTPLLILFTWFNTGGAFSASNLLKHGASQIIVLVIPFIIISSIIGMFHMRKFLKKNRENIKLGQDIEFSDSKFIMEKLVINLFLISSILLVIYFIYAMFFLRNKITMIISMPIIIGIIVGQLYRAFVKPSNKSLNYKKIGLIVAMITASFIAIGVGQFDMFNVTKITQFAMTPNIDDLKVLSVDDFENGEEDSRLLFKRASLLVPKSYDYTSHGKNSENIITEYAKTINQSLAKDLVERYKREARTYILGITHNDFERSFEEKEYSDQLERKGLSEKEFNSLKSKDQGKKEAEEIMKRKAVSKDNENLWDIDDVYFLNYSKTEIVIRKDKEVFYLDGKDFSDPKVIEIVKERLDL